MGCGRSDVSPLWAWTIETSHVTPAHIFPIRWVDTEALSGLERCVLGIMKPLTAWDPECVKSPISIPIAQQPLCEKEMNSCCVKALIFQAVLLM